MFENSDHRAHLHLLILSGPQQIEGTFTNGGPVVGHQADEELDELLSLHPLITSWVHFSNNSLP
jgi:hypothetical protein